MGLGGQPFRKIKKEGGMKGRGKRHKEKGIMVKVLSIKPHPTVVRLRGKRV